MAEAIDLYRSALKAQPDQWPVLFSLGAALRAQGKLVEALEHFLAGIKLKPDLANAHADIGVILAQIGRWPESSGALRRALVLSPDLTGAHNALGVVMKEQGGAREAIPCFSRALVCQPGQPDALFARGESLLQIGQWAEGWAGYRHRFAIPYLNFKPRRYPQPLWRGEPGQGRTLLLWSEQGYGDTIQFSRFAPFLARAGWNVVLEVPPPLKTLLSALPDVTVIANDEPAPPFDQHFPLLDLPGAFGVTQESLSAAAYLGPAPEATLAWSRRLEGLSGRKVGIVWRGRTDNVRERWRGTSAEFFSKFVGKNGLSIVSLQKDARPEELAALGVPVLNAAPDLADFADTAACIANLDLVITTDTAVCHLAGALGVPTWILLDAGADWRWLGGRRDSPWYGSVRLFRQTGPGEWDGVAEQVGRVLNETMPIA